jgi:hypothetical protein
MVKFNSYIARKWECSDEWTFRECSGSGRIPEKGWEKLRNTVWQGLLEDSAGRPKAVGIFSEIWRSGVQ